jgi:two-component system alkaline phosphatase synthesis response regulator PhoP
MIVDDSKLIGITTMNNLEEISPEYAIIYVDSGELCLNVLEHNKFDLVLLDIEMPTMNGWQVFKNMKQNEKLKSVPVAFLTSREDDYSKALGKLLGDAYLEKGLEVKELKGRIEALLNNPVTMDESKAKVIENVLNQKIS